LTGNCSWNPQLPKGKVLIPGIVGHATDFIEHPELVAERLVRYASLVGRESVIAGTACGLGGRLDHPKIVWAKFEALAESPQPATRQLWHARPVEPIGSVSPSAREYGQQGTIEGVLAVSPQCGFASGEAGNPLAPAEQETKLRLVAQVAQRVRSR
jgi:methionine synthase II (cobalamin-independent)